MKIFQFFFFGCELKGVKTNWYFLGNAMALLFPIEWPQPFGLVVLEAMANGTPVIAFNNGCVSEIIEHGRTGFIVNNIEQAVKAVENIHLLSRPLIRKIFENLFTASIMAENYAEIYERICERKKKIFSLPDITNKFKKEKYVVMAF